ncbi:MAG: hypothetical protein ABJL54_05810 [Halioglobus sp.]
MTEHIDNNRGERVLRGLALAALLSALWWLVWTLLLWWRWHPQLPWRDLFVILDDLRPLLQSGSVGEWLTFLVEPHYAAHRLGLPRLLVALDLEYFGARNLLLYIAGWSGLLLLWLLPLRLAGRALDGYQANWWYLAGMWGLFLLAPANLWNLVNGINTAWHLSLALAVCALALLSSACGAPSRGRWLLAYLLATLSAFTTFSGVILWLLLPLFALGGNRRTLIVTLVSSGLLTLAYLQGIASDASVAARWVSEDPEVARQARELGAAALAANSPWRIVHKALTVLGWPLAANWPLSAACIAALSLLVPLIAASKAGRNLLAGQDLPAPWISFCLTLAALTAGTALAIQLGRAMEQPNYAHGPSYERYSTVVALYWCSVTGLLLAWWRRLPVARQATGMASLLVLGWMLLTPRGNYLAQEMESLQTAARLYAAGENPALRRGKGKAPSRFKPAYVYSFDDLFRHRHAAYTRPPYLPPPVELQACSSVGVTLQQGLAVQHGMLELEATVSGALNYAVRDILLADETRLLARLVPVYIGAVDALLLTSRGHTVWRGKLGPGITADKNLRLVLVLPLGAVKQCDPMIANRAPATGKVE